MTPVKSNPWNEWNRLAKASGLSAGMSVEARQVLYQNAKADLLSENLPLTGESIFKSSRNIRDVGITPVLSPVAESPPYSSPVAEPTPYSTGTPVAPTNWSGYSSGLDTDDAASRFAAEIARQTPQTPQSATTPVAPRKVDFNQALQIDRTSMDDEERKEALRFILGKYADRKSLVDDLGLPLGKEQLLTLAKLTPIWSALSDEQKQMFLEESGTFASGRQYVATATRPRKAFVRKTQIRTASGRLMIA